MCIRDSYEAVMQHAESNEHSTIVSLSMGARIESLCGIDMASLLPRSWVRGSVVNMYMALLQVWHCNGF